MARRPVFQRATVTRIAKETADARTFVLAPHTGPFSYRAGQFCTFRVHVDGADHYRSYSMSSAPETDTELMTTVKRVPGGTVSNWLHDNVAEGDEVELTRPAGTFCLRETHAPLLGFSGGSGITPILSLVKSALATTDRPVRVLCADRDAASAIFDSVLAEFVDRYPGRLAVVRHFDDESGLLTPDAVAEFVGSDGAADFYVCGPQAFMDMVEAALPGPGRVFSERFDASAEPIDDTAAKPVDDTAAKPIDDTAAEQGTAQPFGDGTAGTRNAEVEPPASRNIDGTVTIKIGSKKVTVPRHPKETILDSARRGGLAPPFNCEAGNCATCMAKLIEGTATMRVNDALDDDEVEEGYILTCQAVPDSTVEVEYE